MLAVGQVRGQEARSRKLTVASPTICGSLMRSSLTMWIIPLEAGMSRTVTLARGWKPCTRYRNWSLLCACAVSWDKTWKSKRWAKNASVSIWSLKKRLCVCVFVGVRACLYDLVCLLFFNIFLFPWLVWLLFIFVNILVSLTCAFFICIFFLFFTIITLIFHANLFIVCDTEFYMPAYYIHHHHYWWQSCCCCLNGFHEVH